jgi:hypothetical protein
MNSKLIIIYLLVFAAVLILLRTAGTIEINNNELLGYVLMIYGLSLFYSSFISKQNILLFVGSAIFMSGVLFFIIGNFELANLGQLMIPAAIFILSISSLMLFISDKANRTSIYAAIILFAAGIGVLALMGTQGIDKFFENTIIISEIYWPVLVILLAVVVLINRESKQ